MRDLHSDEWWMRVLDGELNEEETHIWETHLAECKACREEWKALNQVDMILQVKLATPALPDDFTQRVTDQIMRKKRLRRILGFLSGAVLAVIMTGGAFIFLSSAFSSLSRAAVAMYLGRHLLFGALMRTVVGLVSTWQMLVPLAILASALGFLLLMPNSVLATLAYVWVARRRMAQEAV